MALGLPAKFLGGIYATLWLSDRLTVVVHHSFDPVAEEGDMKIDE